MRPPSPALYPEPARHVMHDKRQTTVWKLTGDRRSARREAARLKNEQRTAHLLGTSIDGLCDYANPEVVE